jgi:hypothetical protein
MWPTAPSESSPGGHCRWLASLELCASLTCAVSEDGESAKAAARPGYVLPPLHPRKLVGRHDVAYSDVEPVNGDTPLGRRTFAAPSPPRPPSR